MRARFCQADSGLGAACGGKDLSQGKGIEPCPGRRKTARQRLPGTVTDDFRPNRLNRITLSPLVRGLPVQEQTFGKRFATNRQYKDNVHLKLSISARTRHLLRNEGGTVHADMRSLAMLFARIQT